MKQIFCLVIAGFFATVCIGQKTTADWVKKFPRNIQWYKVSDAGILVACTGEGLYGIQPETGEEIWKLEGLDDIQEDNYDPIEGSPYVAIVKGGLIKRHHTIIDVTTGKIITNSKDLGMQTVSKRLELPELGALLFYGFNKVGKTSLTMVSFSDGAVKWEQSALFEKNSEQIVSKPGIVEGGILIATNRNIYKLNAASGDIMWTANMKSDIPVVVPQQKETSGRFAGFKKMKNLFNGEGATEQATATSADFFQKDDKNLVYFWNQDILTALDAATGKEVWKKVELPSPLTQVLWDNNGMLVTTAEKSSATSRKNKAKLMCLDPKTGSEKWSDDVDLQGDVVAYRKEGSKLILATGRDKGTNYISIVDLNAGKSVTKKALKINGEAEDLQIVPQGLYYRTSDEINILDLENGDKTWKKGFKVKNCIGSNLDNKTGFVYANDKVYKVDFEKGDLAEWVANVRFDGKEDPSLLQVRENGVLLGSAQNLSLYDYDGKLIWHSYQQAPGRTMAGKIFSGLGGLASASMGAANMAQSAQLSYSKGYYGSTDPSLDRSIKAHNAAAGAWMGAASSSFKSISKRFNASKEANDYMTMMISVGGSNNAKDAGLVVVGKNDGKPGRQMLLGDKKDPDYQIDELGKVVFYKSGDNTIQGFLY